MKCMDTIMNSKILALCIIVSQLIKRPPFASLWGGSVFLA